MILIAIANFKYNNTGGGGHCYTAMTVFNGLSEVSKCAMLVIGDSIPKSMDVSNNKIHFVNVSRSVSRKDIGTLTDLIESLKVSVVHCFDDYSLCFLREACSSLKLPTICTKCGGPRPKLHYYPRISPDIVFSPMDKQYFESRARFFRRPSPYLIPNRVLSGSVMSSSSGLLNLPISFDENSLKIIRVGRICFAYEESFLQTLRLAQALREMGHNVSAYLVGIIQDQIVYERIKDQATCHDYLLTEDAFTKNGSRHLKDVDFVVATGRGVMEACGSGKAVFCTTGDTYYPVLMTGNNFWHFYNENFSPRVKKPLEYNEKKEFNFIEEIIVNKNTFKNYSKQMESIFTEYFDFNSVSSAYLNIYKEATFDKPSLFMSVDKVIHKNLTRAKLLIKKVLVELSFRCLIK